MDTTTEERYLTEVTLKLKSKISEVEVTLDKNEANYKELKHYTIDYKMNWISTKCTIITKI